MKKLYSIALASSLFLLGSCASDAPEVNPGSEVDTSGVGFIRFDFTRSASTRDGHEIEEEPVAINTADFLFYSEDGRYLGNTEVTVGANGNGKYVWIDQNHDAATGDNRTVDACVALAVPYADASRVTVILNKSVTIVDQGDQIQTIDVAGGNYLNSNDNWMMSNSVRYGTGNMTTDPNNSQTWRVKIDKRYIYQTIEAAQAATAQAAAQVNVERMVSKMTITKGATLMTGTTVSIGGKSTTTDENLVFSNAGDADKTYYRVEFTPKFATVLNQAAKGSLIKKLPPYNDSWTNNFKTAMGNGSHIAANHGGGLLDNPSIKDLTENSEKLFTDNVRYLYDNNGTYGAGTATSVALTGTYNVYKKVGDAAEDLIAGAGHATNKTFYLLGVGEKWRIYTDETEVKTIMGGGAENTLVPQMQSGKWTGYYVLGDAEGNTTGVKTIYPCLKYTNGLGFYSARIVAFTADSKPETYISRNHSYTVSIDKIEGMGWGVDNTTRIIPVDPPKPGDKSFYMHISVNCLDWVAVPTQSVKW